jgi:uncharacterized protein (TIGR00661 family)
MNQALKGKIPGKPRILVAPLDWGLGHTTRCIPIIKELIKQGAEVWLAGNQAQEKIFKEEFSQLNIIYLPGYGITYSKTRVGILWKMITQFSKIRKAIQFENAWLKEMVNKHAFDAVISDNRFGLCHAKVPCVFITHQLHIKSPYGKWTESLLQKWNYRHINRFTACWVPDSSTENNLAGSLSHPTLKPTIPLVYINSLSRFEKNETLEIKNHLLISLSGPEPQRTTLENKIIDEISRYQGTATIVRGLPTESFHIPSTTMIKFYNHLNSVELNNEMMKAEFIICRAGYSSIMDIVALQKKSILIPTPGQTEQEYLSDYLSQKSIFFCIAQKEFSLEGSLQKARQFAYLAHKQVNDPSLAQTIAAFLSKINTSV